MEKREVKGFGDVHFQELPYKKASKLLVQFRKTRDTEQEGDANIDLLVEVCRKEDGSPMFTRDELNDLPLRKVIALLNVAVEASGLGIDETDLKNA